MQVAQGERCAIRILIVQGHREVGKRAAKAEPGGLLSWHCCVLGTHYQCPCLPDPQGECAS